MTPVLLELLDLLSSPILLVENCSTGESREEEATRPVLAMAAGEGSCQRGSGKLYVLREAGNSTLPVPLIEPASEAQLVTTVAGTALQAPRFRAASRTAVIAKRARIVLGCDEELSNSAVAERLG